MIQPPGRIEQLNNFQDSVQSPDGLDRLRALQYIQEALPSSRSQGLMGMPQVTVPQMQPQGPILNREGGGPTAGLITKYNYPRSQHKGPIPIGSSFSDETKVIMRAPIRGPHSVKSQDIVQVVEEPVPVSVPEDTMKVFARDEEGIRNRAIQGGVLEGQRYTPTGGGTTTASIPTLKGFGSKEEAIAHHNQSGSGGLINVYQLDDGSWDYTRAEESPELMGRPTTPGAPINVAQPNNMLSTGPFTKVSGVNFPGGPRALGQLITPGGPAMAEGGYIQHREGGGQIDPAEAAQGLASLGRYGDNMLVHMNPEEVEGLMSLGKITYNPITGLPEAWGWGSIMKTVRRLAPVVLAIAAPYAFGATTALGIGASTALGSFAGNIIAGAKPKDALKSGLMTGLMAGGGAYFGGAASGFGGGTAQAGAAGTSGAVTTNMSGVPSYGGISGQVSGPVTAGRSITQAGLGNSAGYGGINQGITPQASQFTNKIVNTAGAPSYGGTQTQPLQLAPQQGTYVSPQASQTYGGSFTPDVQAQPAIITTGPETQANQVRQFNEQLDAPRGARIGEGGARIEEGSTFTTQGPAPQANQFASEVSPEMAKLSEAQLRGPGSTSIFKEGGLSKENLGKMGGEIYDKYSTTGGIAKLVGMDLMTPDWEAQYAAEAAAKNKQLTDAGYTVDTGFNGQTIIRDSSGVQMPKTLTIQQILDRALGKTPRTNLVARYGYGPSNAKEGGLISLAQGGEFSGIVSGDGHGMEDNVYMPIVEKGHGSQVGTLAVSPSEYVVDSYTMAALGNGNADAGAKVMDNVVKGVRKKAYGNMRQPNEINGLSALQPMIERI